MVNWENSNNPIDEKLDRCLDAAGLNEKSQLKCQREAYDSWDTELANVYRQLKQGLPVDEKISLGNEQRAFLANRENENQRIENFGFHPDSYMWSLKSVDSKERTIKLHDRLKAQIGSSALDADTSLAADDPMAMPLRFTDKQMESSANTVYERIADAYNSDKPIDLHKSHNQFAEALNTGRLDELVDRVNEKIWGPDGIHHLNLIVTDGPPIANAISKRVLLERNHTGTEVSHDDVHVAASGLQKCAHYDSGNPGAFSGSWSGGSQTQRR
jgi:uncharacterized protein YecT (DUF1311 family)